MVGDDIKPRLLPELRRIAAPAVHSDDDRKVFLSRNRVRDMHFEFTVLHAVSVIRCERRAGEGKGRD